MHRIHVRQDHVTHMHRLSKYQKQCQKRIESIKHLLHDRMSQNRSKSEYKQRKRTSPQAADWWHARLETIELSSRVFKASV
jgi:hypothetical protein